MNPLIKTKVEAYQNEAIRIRRYLHQHPELSAKEYQTQQFIIDELNKHHIQCEKIADTGVVALVKGTKSGPQRTLLMRADLDALPINETTNVDFKSLNAGVMHACGHDGHMTNLLIAAFILNDLRDQFSGSVKFMFQPAEEAIGGCERMIKAGILENPHVDGAIGFHVDADHDVGEVSTKIGE
jgi:amidohydrolase